MNDVTNNIKKVLIVFMILFLSLTLYISYFEIYTAPKVISSSYNARLWVQRNEVLRGTIYDRNHNPLTKSVRVNASTQKREYTAGAAFANVLGYVDPRYGITGLEKTYDSQLMKDDTGILNIFNFTKVKKAKVGRDLVTTLDMNLQEKAYNLLGNNKGAVVALNPKTGEILAMVSKPSFNPNYLDTNWSTINNDKNRPLLNRAVSGLYPPGSTFKVVSALSSIENLGGVKNKTFHDNGKLVFNSTQSLSDFEGEVPGDVSFKDAFVLSSNVVFGGLGLDLGNDKLKSTAEKFYFNKTIPSDGIIIDNSKFPSYKKNEAGNIAQSAIGQSGVLASPMQMALVASTIANGGVMMEPYLVNKVMTNKGSLVKETTPASIATVATSENSDYIKDLMRAVVSRGTGTAANIPGLDVCGKTGTADYDINGVPAEAHSWFIGLAPYNNPKIAISVIVENGGQGGVLAASIAGKLIKYDLEK
ncbi:peptidoglycan D,D-transpeptidase FtsI family protein [Clostridium tagluense]|uniref:peptidoglycan D,D-transpeptidase FtsI family protein n=1 Tax=Clostridium tagluense TaxID=360422 RepID=UPI001C0D3670|nr:penicillin-binding transpeptidase domain-containing protein [Clostridium tagluense]MBU3128967.1 penicillin-binding protein 2 [Clostridium tagluense]